MLVIIFNLIMYPSGYYDNTTSPACIRPILNCEEEGIGYCKNGVCVNDEYTFHCECHHGWEGKIQMKGNVFL